MSRKSDALTGIYAEGNGLDDRIAITVAIAKTYIVKIDSTFCNGKFRGIFYILYTVVFFENFGNICGIKKSLFNAANFVLLLLQR